MDPMTFLDSVSGYARGQDKSSSDRPIRLATIDPDHDYDLNYPNASQGVKVQFEGESGLSGKLYPVAQGLVLTGGQRVFMLPIGNTYLVAGIVGGPIVQGFYQYMNGGTPEAITEFGGGSYADSLSGLFIDGEGYFMEDVYTRNGRVIVTNKKAGNTVLGAWAHTSAGYGFVTGGPTPAFTKLHSATETKLIVGIKVGFFSTVIPTTARFGASVGGVLVDIDQVAVDVANVPRVAMGWAEITTLNAGTHATGIVGLRVSGTGILSTNNNQRASITIEEVPV